MLFVRAPFQLSGLTTVCGLMGIAFNVYVRRFLKRKKLEKKRKGQGVGAGFESGGQVLVPAELRLKEQQAATTARFGEVADAPLKVGLHTHTHTHARARTHTHIHIRSHRYAPYCASGTRIRTGITTYSVY